MTHHCTLDKQQLHKYKTNQALIWP